MQQPLRVKPHITKFDKYIIHPIELSGTYLEYLFKNNLIRFDPKFNHFGTKTYNFVLETGYLGKIKGSESILTEVKSIDKPTTIKNNKSLIRKQTITTIEGDKQTLTTNATYLLRINKIINFMHNVIKKPFNEFKDTIKIDKRYSDNISNEDILKTQISDIHRIRRTKDVNGNETIYFTLRPKTIIEHFNIDDDIYLLVGYPDWFKMVDHDLPIDKDILSRYENIKNKDSNYNLFIQFAKLLGKLDGNNNDTNNNNTNDNKLWEYVNGHTDMTCLEKNFKDIYQKNLPEYKQLLIDYIDKNQVFNQCLTRIKYIFHVFKLNKVTGEFEIFIETLQDLKFQHQTLLEQINNFIKKELYHQHLHTKLFHNDSEKIIMSYVRFSGFFHIESEFIHPLSNYYQFNYMSYNTITLEELIYTLNYPDFWNRVSLDFFVTERKLSNIQSGGAILIDPDAIKLLQNDTSKCHVVLLHSTHNKRVFSIIEYQSRYLYLELIGNKLPVTDTNTNEFTKIYIEPAKMSSHQSLNDDISFELELINLGNLHPYKIISLYYIDKYPTEHKLLADRFLKYTPVVNVQLTNKMIREPSINVTLPYVIPFIKLLMLYNYLINLNPEHKFIDLLLKYNSRGKFCEGKPNVMKSLSGNYYAIYYMDLASLMNDMSDSDFKESDYYYIVWLVSKNTYHQLQNEIENIFKADVNFDYIVDNYLQQETEIDDDMYLKNIYDINKNNYQEVFQLIDNVLDKLKLSNPETFIHSHNDICSKCLHIKIKSKNSYSYALSKAQYLTDNSRTLSYNRLKEFVTKGDPQYYYNGIVNAYVDLSWSFIFAYNILNKQLMQQSAGGKLITIKKLDTLPEYKKAIYDNIRESKYSYDDYIDIINVTNVNKIVMNVDNLIDNPTTSKIAIEKDSNIYKNLKTFNQLTNVEYQHWGGLMASVKINNLFNTGNLAIITNSLNIALNLDQINNVEPFDILLDNCGLNKKVCQDFTDKLNTCKHIKNIFGNYHDYSIDLYPQMIVQHNNMYKSVAIPNNGYYFLPYPTIFHPLSMPSHYMRLILGLFILMDKGNMFIHKRISFKYPLMEQYYDTISYFFKDVDYEFGDEESVFLYCSQFDRNKFMEYEGQFKQLLLEMSKHTVSDFAHVSSDYFFYHNDKHDNKSVSIPYKLNISIPSSQISESLMKVVSNRYYAFLEKVDHLMIRYLPLTQEKTMYILNNVIYDYVKQLIKFNEQYKIPYNKYYLNFLDDYYQEVYKNIYSFSNNITVHIINYPVKSISMKRHKSLTNRNMKDTKSNSIRQYRDYLRKITGKNGEYAYEEFEPYIQKLLYVKQNKNVLVKKYGKENIMKVKRVVEDFTKGVNVYLYQRFKLDIKPSNAFTKLWEMYIQFDLVPDKKTIRMFHLAEAPGQFIKTTEYFIKKHCPKCEQYLWKANSLNLNSPEVRKLFGNNVIITDDYGLIKKYKEHWIWGADDTGDITRSKNIRWYRKYLKEWAGNDKIDVVTGDGGMTGKADMKDLQKLDYGQFLLTVATCSIGKHCVIKIFTPFIGEDLTTYEDSGGFFVGMLFLYSLLFKNLYLVKPYTSRPINGEYYIVGKGFMGLPDFAFERLCHIMDTFKLNQTFFDKKYIPNSFVKQCVKFIEEMHNLNATALERQLFFLSCSHDTQGTIAKKTNCDYYLDPKNLRQIHEERYKKWVKMFKFK